MPNEQYTTSIQVKLKPSQKQAFERIAATYGLSTSGWVREQALREINLRHPEFLIDNAVSPDMVST